MGSQTALDQAIAMHQTGNLEDAERLYLEILAGAPGQASAHHLLGVVRAQQGRITEALELIGRALEIDPNVPEFLSNYGNVLRLQGRLAEALDNFTRALQIKPDYAAAWNRQGQVLRDLKRSPDALASFDRALTIRPDYVEAWSNRGVLLSDLQRHDEALASFDRALALAPNFPDALNNRALTLKSMRRLDEALASCDRALALYPSFVEALNNRGIILLDLKRTREALTCFDRALALRPDHVEALNNRAAAHWGLRQFAESLADCDRALSMRPDFADALYNRANALIELGQAEEALHDYEQALAQDPDHPNALSGLANAAMTIGDWARTARLGPVLKQSVLTDRCVIQPFVCMGYWDDNELQLKCSENYVRRAGPPDLRPLWGGDVYRHDKIRIAYLSADFHQHVTAALTAEMFETHDRELFDVNAVSFGPDDGSSMRARLKRSFDRFHDARFESDRDVALLLRQWEIDIAVDLGGHTNAARPWILAHRPAPVQLKYMGYPGTSGCAFIDYMIADDFVVPAEERQFFSEKIVWLPDTLWVIDSKRSVSPPPTRTEAGLPEGAFVFCCFNHNWKITPAIFDVWMRLLGKIENSILWLLQGNSAICRNLRQQAEARGIDPARLYFAERAPPEKHIARQQLADLFLDTLPYNAHTTASDALWAGLPLITLAGRSLPARVAGSVLRAAELPQLIAKDLTEYEALAFNLATQQQELHAIRKKLLQLRKTAPLFNTVRFTRHLESAYMTMLEVQRKGQEKQSFSVTRLDG